MGRGLDLESDLPRLEIHFLEGVAMIEMPPTTRGPQTPRQVELVVRHSPSFSRKM